MAAGRRDPAIRIAWLVLTVVSVGLGVAGAALTDPRASLLGLGIGACVGGLLHPRVPARAVSQLVFGPGARRGGPVRRPVTSVLAGAGGGLVLVGLFAVPGVNALAFAAAWTAGGYVLWPDRGRLSALPGPLHPAAARRDGDRHSGRGEVPAHRQGGTEPAPLPVSAPSSWSTERVCRAWQTSFVQLQSARSAGDTAWVARLARERQTYLDELDRRDRAGFAAWLTSGARAAGDPHRHLGGEEAARPGPAGSYLDPDRPDTVRRHGWSTRKGP